MASKTKNEHRLLYGFFFLLLIASTVILSRFFYQKYQRLEARKRVVTNEARPQVDFSPTNALAQLKAEEGNPNDLRSMLVQYTNKNLPESEQMIQQYLRHSNPQLQGAALQALGRRDDAQISVFREALASSDASIRLAALRGLGLRISAERLAIVEEFIIQPQVDPKEWLAGQMALYRLQSDKNKKKTVELKVLDRLRGLSIDLQVIGYSGLANTIEKSEDFAIIARKALSDPGQSLTAPSMLQYAVRYDREWLKQEMERLPMREDLAYQVHFVNFLAASCPPNRQKLLVQLSQAFSLKQLPSAAAIEAECVKKQK